MKPRARRLVVAAIVLVLAIAAGLLGLGVWSGRPGDLPRQALDLLPNVAQRIKNFHRVKIDDERKVWEVTAREARYLDDDDLVVVEGSVVSVFLEDGREITLRGKEGRLFLDERELKRVEVSGSITVELGEYTLQTEFAEYEPEGEVIRAPGSVQISGEQFDIHGEQMEVQVSTQQLRMLKNVRMTFRPRPRG